LELPQQASGIFRIIPAGLFAISLLLPVGIGLLLLGQIWFKDGRKLENHQRSHL
jgi:hypothetical protein